MIKFKNDDIELLKDGMVIIKSDPWRDSTTWTMQFNLDWLLQNTGRYTHYEYNGRKYKEVIFPIKDFKRILKMIARYADTEMIIQVLNYMGSFKGSEKYVEYLEQQAEKERKI